MNYIEIKYDIKNISKCPEITNWERMFLESLYNQLKPNRKLSSKQLNKLNEIKTKSNYISKDRREIKVIHNKCMAYIPEAILNQLRDILKEEKGKYNIYLYGSQIYGNQHINSDFDFLVVFEKEIKREQYVSNTIDITYKSKSEVINHLKEGNINFLENIQGLVEGNFEIEVDLILDKSFIKNVINQARNSLKKGIRFINSGDKNKIYKGKKSLFHALRILLNAKNLLLKEVIDFDKINTLYEESKNYSYKEYRKDFYKNADKLWNILYQTI
jgi:predicted nucleotidyltransferase